MAKPVVSIVIPTYNRATLLPRAIDSALAQSEACEVIVCNHGSTDHTDEVAARYQDKITYITREKDFGPHFCWLEGVMHSNGDYIHLLYDDDWAEPSFIKTALRLMHDTVGMVFANATVIGLDKEQLPYQCFPEFRAKQLTTGMYDSKILEHYLLGGGVMISPATCLFRKQIMMDALYQGRLPLSQKTPYHGVGPDHLMSLLSLLEYPKFGYIAEDMVWFGAHDGSITFDSKKTPEKQKQLWQAYHEVLHYYRMLKREKIIRAVRTWLANRGLLRGF
jgi:glycosyltransferase involved in cell wall biosynthesis